MAYFSLIWDLDDDPEGNVQHIAEHDLTKEEVEDVLLNLDNLETESDSSGRPIVLGETETGRYIAVVYEVALEDPLMIRVVTAYDVGE
jgi:uncharacterized DUF497 family protein